MTETQKAYLVASNEGDDMPGCGNCPLLVRIDRRKTEARVLTYGDDFSAAQREQSAARDTPRKCMGSASLTAPSYFGQFTVAVKMHACDPLCNVQTIGSLMYTCFRTILTTLIISRRRNTYSAKISKASFSADLFCFQRLAD
jgi:hypothetical protein